MSKRRSALHVAILLVASSSTASVAQSKVCVEQLSPGIPCCGQYACVADQPLATSRGYPQHIVQAPGPDRRILGIAQRTSRAKPMPSGSTFLRGGGHHD
jgi:hypothetical protein